MSLRVETEMDHRGAPDIARAGGRYNAGLATGFDALRRALMNLDGDLTIDRVFLTAGKAFRSAETAEVGALLGSMLCDIGNAFSGRVTFGAEEAVWMLEIMEQALVRGTNAQSADRTMLDALHPAVIAAQESENEDIVEVLRRAGEAASDGARDSRMLSRLGSGCQNGDQTLGHGDSGATCMALILRSLEESVTALKATRGTSERTDCRFVSKTTSTFDG
jgi:dihydroxyacetone kinase